MGLLEELERVVGTVAERAGPAVVGVDGRGRGSGIVVADGRVLTNAHNTGASTVEVHFAGGRRAEAEVAGLDADRDLAVLAADTAGAAPLAWADGAEVPPGRVVLALGAAAGGGRVTWGTVSATGRAFRGPRGRLVTGAIEHTAPLARGSSGGPLLDTEGRLLGVNTHRRGDGFYLAIPADDALRQRVEALGRGEQPARQRLGVALAPGRLARELRAAVGLPERAGLLVRAVEDGGPAARAGIRQGDLLVEAAGRPLESLDDIFVALDAAPAGEPLALGVVRGTEELSVTVVFEAAGEA